MLPSRLREGLGEGLGAVPHTASPASGGGVLRRTAVPRDMDARNNSTAVRFNFGTGSVPTRETVFASSLSPRP